jgi:ribosomal protein L35
MMDDDEQKIKRQKAEQTHLESKQASKQQQQQQRVLKETDVSSDAVADHLSSAFFSVASI